MKSFKSLTLVYFCSKLGILYKLCRSSSHTYFNPTFGPLIPSKLLLTRSICILYCKEDCDANTVMTAVYFSAAVLE